MLRLERPYGLPFTKLQDHSTLKTPYGYALLSCGLLRINLSDWNTLCLPATKKGEISMITTEIKRGNATIRIHDEYFVHEPRRYMSQLSQIVTNSHKRMQQSGLPGSKAE